VTSPAQNRALFTKLSSSANTSMSAAFSLRALNSTSAKVANIRNGSSSITADFYGDGNGNLTTGINGSGQSLTTWLNGATAYITILYDQSPKGANATQTTNTLQPKITGTMIDFTGTSYMNLPSGTVPMNTAYTFVVHHGTIGNGNGGFIGAGGNNTNRGNNFRADGSAQGYWNYWYYNDAGASSPTVSGNIVTCRYDGPTTSGNTTFFINGIQKATTQRSGWQGVSGNEVLGKTTADVTLNGQLYSLFVFNSALSDADRILTEQNS
jgi:hypothetical protein